MTHAVKTNIMMVLYVIPATKLLMMKPAQLSIITTSVVFASVLYALSVIQRIVSAAVRAETTLHFRILLLVHVAAMLDIIMTLKDSVFLVTQIVRYVVTLLIRTVQLVHQETSSSQIGTHVSSIAPQALQRILLIIPVEVCLPVLYFNFRLNHGQRTSNKYTRRYLEQL